MVYYLYINSSDEDIIRDIKNTPGFRTSIITLEDDTAIISHKVFDSLLHLTEEVSTLPLKIFDKHNEIRQLNNDERLDMMLTLTRGGFVDTELYIINSCDGLHKKSSYLIIDQSIDYATQRPQRTAEITEHKTTKTLKQTLIDLAIHNRSYPRFSELVIFDTTLSIDEILHLTIKELIMYINCNIYNTKVTMFKGLRVI